MKIVMVAVTSLNGKITRGFYGQVFEWSSKEDQEHFSKVRDKSKLIVMGSGTYSSIRTFIKLSPEILRIVLTKTPDKYKRDEVPGLLEFSSESPIDLVQRLSKKYKEMLLVGGGQINGAFLNAGLVNEILLTVEPVLFGEGVNLIDGVGVQKKLILVSVSKLNKQGTILYKYKVV